MGRPRTSDPIKFCPHCGDRMERNRFNGRLEDLSAFRRRVYCNRECMAAAYVSDAPSRGTLLWRARKFLGPRCESCGATTKLQVHHIDGKQHNNSAQNIQTLCASCHTSHHHHARAAGRTVPGRMASGELDIPFHIGLIV